MAFGNNIKRLRDIYDLKQSDIAIIAGVTDKAVWAWENTSKMPKMGTVEKIAEHFGLKKSNLIEDDGLNALSAVTQKNNQKPTETAQTLVAVFTQEEVEYVNRLRALSPAGREMLFSTFENIEKFDRHK